jgi:serine/threonine protein kinase
MNNIDKKEDYIISFPDLFISENNDSESESKSEPSKYILLKIIGRGPHSVIFLVKKISDGIIYCIKLSPINIEASLIKNEKHKKRIYSEVECMNNCNFFSLIIMYNKGIVEKKDSEDSSDEQLEEFDDYFYKHENEVKLPQLKNKYMYIVMEYMKYGDLRQKIKLNNNNNDKISENDAMIIFIQLLLGVHYMHTNKIIHRDIKPANILMYHDKLVKLADFGFAIKLKKNKLKEFLGTPYYIAPEIWEKKEYDEKIDIFSMGVVLYEILTFRRPFQGNTLKIIQDKIIATEYKQLPDYISINTQNLIKNLLNKDPLNRPSTIDILQMDFVQDHINLFLTYINSNDLINNKIKENINLQIKKIYSEIIL